MKVGKFAKFIIIISVSSYPFAYTTFLSEDWEFKLQNIKVKDPRMLEINCIELLQFTVMFIYTWNIIMIHTCNPKGNLMSMVRTTFLCKSPALSSFFLKYITFNLINVYVLPFSAKFLKFVTFKRVHVQLTIPFGASLWLYQ